MRQVHGRSQMMSRQKATNDEKNAIPFDGGEMSLARAVERYPHMAEKFSSTDECMLVLFEEVPDDWELFRELIAENGMHATLFEPNPDGTVFLQLRAHLAIAPFLPEVVEAQIDSNDDCGNCGCPLTRGEVGFRFSLPSGDDPDKCDIRYYSVFCSRECISVVGRPLVTVPPWKIEGQDEV